MTLEQRLERLERQNRWMRRIGAVGIAAVAVVMLVGQGESKELPDSEVRSLTVKDREGTVRAELTTQGEDLHPCVILRDESGTERVRLTVAHDSPYLGLRDENGKGRAAFGVLSQGGPFLSLWDKLGKERARLDTLDDGSPRLELSDEQGRVRASLQVRGAGGTLELLDADGKVIWKAPGE